jgi:hypothetical protein
MSASPAGRETQVPIGGWVGPRTGMDKRKFLTLSGLELRPLGRQVHSQSLYSLVCSSQTYDGQVLTLSGSGQTDMEANKK